MLLIRSSILWTALIVLSAFWFLAFHLPSQPLIEFLRLLQTSSALAVVIAYAPGAYRVVRSDRPTFGEQLLLGVTIGFAGVFLNGVWAMLWRLSGQPDWMYNSDFNAFLVYISVVACALHLMAPGAIDGRIPRSNWLLIGSACGCAFLGTVILLMDRPNASAFVRWLEAWM